MYTVVVPQCIFKIDWNLLILLLLVLSNSVNAGPLQVLSAVQLLIVLDIYTSPFYTEILEITLIICPGICLVLVHSHCQWFSGICACVHTSCEDTWHRYDVWFLHSVL